MLIGAGGVFVLSGREAILVGTRRFSKENSFLGLGFALVMLICCAMASAQTGGPIERGPVAAKPGSVIGTVLDQSGAVSVGKVIRLTPQDESDYRQVLTGDNGQFSFSNVPAGHFQLSVSSTGFGNEVYSGDLAPGQTFLAPPIVLSVATVVTEVKVTVDPVEVATEEIKLEEHQRALGFIPNIYVSYRPDAAPLTTKLKYQLAWKSSTDVVTIGGAAFLAGLQQAGNEYSGFGQGAQGYAKRFGAVYGDVVASTFLSGAVFPSLLKQDPRYFFRGTGSKKKRLLYAISNSVMCKGDNGRWQVNYSNMAGVVLARRLCPPITPRKTKGWRSFRTA